MNWEPILWIGGILVTIIAGELGFIVVLLRKDRDDFVMRLDAHDKKFNEQQSQIFELASNTRETLAIIKTKLKLK